MKVTVDDIIKIKAGKAMSFDCENPLQAKSGMSLVSYVKKFRRDAMPGDVSDYETSINGNILTVVAVKG